MSSILYYSQYCSHSQRLLQRLANTDIQNDIHFICVDRRVRKQDGVYIQFPNGLEVLLPPMINSVPTLLALNRGNMIIQGDDIERHLFASTPGLYSNSHSRLSNTNVYNGNHEQHQSQSNGQVQNYYQQQPSMRKQAPPPPQKQTYNNTPNAQVASRYNNVRRQNVEPECYSISDFGGIISDSFSFLDQSSDELSAKGNGGMRQIHNYAAIDYVDKIETPPEDYVPDKVGDISLDDYQKMRNSEVGKPIQRM